ncbi:hypothetical protein ACJ73_04990, partial [Blastomyces percursus]
MALNPLRPSAAAARNLTLLRHAPRGTTITTTQLDRARHHSSSASSVSSDEITHFSCLASSWWDPLGPSRILHLMNPLRHEFIASCIAESNPRSDTSPPSSSSSSSDPYNNKDEDTNRNTASPQGLRYLDIGCGGGIFAESLARTIPPASPASQNSTNTGTSATATTLSPVTHASSILAIDPSPVTKKIATYHARANPSANSSLLSGGFNYGNKGQT